MIASTTAAIENLEERFTKMGIYVLCVVFGVVVQHIFILPVIYFIFVRKNPLILYGKLAKAWLVGFATTSAWVPVFCILI